MDNNVTQKGNFSSFFKEAFSLILIIIFAFSIRTFLVEPFYVPSGSLKPNVLEGEYLVSTKYSYGYSKYSLPFFVPLFEGRIFAKSPERGDIIIFWPPNGHYRYIKRLIGLPGDKLQVINGVIHINDVAVPKQEIGTFISEDNVEYIKYQETLPNNVKYEIIEMKDPLKGQKYYNTQIYLIPEGKYFFMGDNRDDSNDSRVSLGLIPEENIISKAQFIFLSMKKQLWLPSWNNLEQIPRIIEIPSWLLSIRPSRIFTKLTN